MKALAFLLLLTLAAAATASAATSGKKVGTVTTLRGKTYRQCEVAKVYPDGVAFRHSTGVAKVLFTDLSKDWRNRLGYSPARAAAYQQEIAARREREVKARARREEELGRALIEAERLQRIRDLGVAAQAQALVQAAAASSFTSQSYAGIAYPVLPPLGLVYDSRDFRRGYRYSNSPFYGSGYGYGYGFGHPYGYGGWHGANFCRPAYGFSGGFSRGGYCPPSIGVAGRSAGSIVITR